MLDFLLVSARPAKGSIEIYPKFIARKSKDLMIRGGDFYAIWDEEHGLWSTDEDVAVSLIDNELDLYAKEHEKDYDSTVRVLHLWDTDTCMIDKWHKYVQTQLADNYKALDEKIIFSNSEPKKEDYASKRLPYSLGEGDISAYEELMSTIYSPKEREKIEWAIGSIISGDSKKNQKFLVLYGPAGSGKSTVLNIIQMLFDGYFSVFDAKALASANGAFALEAFKNNPLVAIQHDGDLSKIEDNTKLNSIVSHELMVVNEKFKSTYSSKFNCFLFMGTNKPVRITDAKSGIIRRLIDVTPTDQKLPRDRYFHIMHQIKFELGAIALHCLNFYNDNKKLYDDYEPLSMMGATNDFYNFIQEYSDQYQDQDSTTLKSSWALYKEYCEYAKVAYPYSQRAFKEELKNYFKRFEERHIFSDGTSARNYYEGFKDRRENYIVKRTKDDSLVSLFGMPLVSKDLYPDNPFEKLCADCPAQYASSQETPTEAWASAKHILKDLDTSKLHFVKVPLNHIVIDFDLKNSLGEKSLELNLKAAESWPKTYAELSKSGKGLHLHYIYQGDPEQLSNLYSDGIEIKVFKGGASLRRKLSLFIPLSIATISSGLPLKGEKKVIEKRTLKNEKALRALIIRNLNKEIHPGTKPSIDFIKKILDDAYSSGLKYDVSDMMPTIFDFAMHSTNHATYCMQVATEMMYKSADASDSVENDEKPIVFFDVEVFPNLFVVCWKYQGEGKEIVKMINPKPEKIEKLLDFRLIGFNNRKYDNHILYAALMGYSNADLYNLSQRLISNRSGTIREAYNISYADIYDFSSLKQSLKKFEIDLGIHHQELGLPWDQPVDQAMWPTVADYCTNDVIATEATFNARIEDFNARKILANLSGLTVNDTTRMHATKIIFGSEQHPQLVYTDLSELFPGYVYENGKSTYRGEEVGEGGYVYAEPGMYGAVALLDIASMHPTSLIELNYLGDYTPKFVEIKDARVAVKHHDVEKASKMLGGALKEYLSSDESMDRLAFALKIVINSIYGYTAAAFDNPFRDPRNVDNIVAKRGALFMINLKHEVQAKGYTVVHIKTDSIKISDADPDIIQFVMDYGKKYGYNFEHEATYDKICLVNDAVYIAKYKGGKHDGEWTATGAQFQHPYVFKTLFSHEALDFSDFCEARSVTTAMYLDMNENLKEGEHAYKFIGRAGLFCPVHNGGGGGILLREKDGKYYAVGGTKGYRWLESEVVRELNKTSIVDYGYFDALADDAKAAIENFGSFEWFVSDIPYDDSLPWKGGNIPFKNP